MKNIKDILIRDPYVLVFDGKYYLFGTTDENAWSGKGDSFIGYESEDLINFSDGVKVFSASDNFWADENFWAPEVHFYNGKFYMFASFKKNGLKRASQILVSNTPLGEYKPLGNPITPKEWECLDATLYVENGEPYCIYSHEWTQTVDGEMILVKLNNDLTKVISEPKLLFKASDAPWVRKMNNGGYITDGAYIYKHSNGKLYMLWSSLGEKGYAMGVAVADNIMSEWKHVKTPLFESNGGHGMIFKGLDKQLYMTLHCPNEPHLAERAIFIPIRETENGIEKK